MVDELFAAKLNWLEKYGTILAIGIIAVMMIVLMTQYWDFVGNSLAMHMETVKESLTPIEKLANAMINK